jgi:hypothetical protein
MKLQFVHLFKILAEKILSDFLDMPEIAFHAVKAELPALAIRSLLEQVAAGGEEIDIELFKFAGIMYISALQVKVLLLQKRAKARQVFSHKASAICHQLLRFLMARLFSCMQHWKIVF